MVRSFSHARTEKPEVNGRKGKQKGNFAGLRTSGRSQMGTCKHGHGMGVRWGGLGGSEEVDKDGPQGTFKDQKLLKPAGKMREYFPDCLSHMTLS